MGEPQKVTSANGWDEWKRHVLHELSEQGTDLKQLVRDVEQLKAKMSVIAAVAGTVGGGVVALAFKLVG